MSEDSKKKKDSKRSSGRYLQLTGIGLQMAITIFLAAYAGRWLDEKYPSNKKWFTIGLTIFAVVGTLISVVRQVNRLNELDDKDNQ